MSALQRKKLTTYRAKRDFKKTAEPSGQKGNGAGTGNTYLIQKHAATRLHYDFRLEMDGVLKSWAVTRGPSLDPADKRLAVHVEDHPLDYGSFEGTIPKDQYGGGTVMLWDTGTWEPIGDARRDYRKGHLSFILHGQRLKGEWHLVRMGGRAAGQKKENWLLIKSHDEYAKEGGGNYAIERYQKSAVSGRSMEMIAREGGQPIETIKPASIKKKSPILKNSPARNIGKDTLPDFVAPELATLVSKPPKGDRWVHEIKFDGYRALARIESGKVRMLTRANNDWTQKFRVLADALKKLPVKNAMIDGEIVAPAKDGTMSFNALQNALGSDRQERLHYYMFDLLFLNGHDLRHEPLSRRKEALRVILPKDHPQLHFSEHFNEPGVKVLQHACRIALEGIVSKRIDAPYSSGRGKDWLKSKCINEQEMVIGGYTEQPKHPGTLGALLIGYYQGSDLIFSGKVGTGYSREQARRLLGRVRKLGRKQSPFKSVPSSERKAFWIEPKLVAQISFTEWTKGGALRHPSFHGLREDKPAKQVTREKEIDPGDAAKSSRPGSAKRGKIRIADVAITHPDKILYPNDGITKLQLVEYYAAAAPYLLPHVVNRPISLMRCPDGIGKACFFQRHIDEGLPPHVKKIPVQINEKRNYLYIEDERGLIELIQIGVLEIHTWGAHIDTIDQPDRIVFDLDPGEDVPWPKVKRAALDIRAQLRKSRLESFLEATGGKGFHVVAPIKPGPDWKTVKDFTHQIGEQMMKDDPKLYTTSSRKESRVGRIFIDYLRNGKGASAIAPYSTRARPGAPIAAPLAWEELNDLKNAHPYDISSILKRLKKDPWKSIYKLRQALPKI